MRNVARALVFWLVSTMALLLLGAVLLEAGHEPIGSMLIVCGIIDLGFGWIVSLAHIMDED